MRTPAPVADPWAADIDNGWRDIVSSAPPPAREPPARQPPAREPPPLPMMRELATREIHLRNQSMPSDLNAWQEHGSARAASAVVDEPNFSSGDRRMWLIAGGLMALAALVLGLLGLLTYGARGADAASPVEPARAIEATRAPAPTAATPRAPAPTAATPRAPVDTPVLGASRASAPTHGKKHHSHHHRPLASASR
jgi:hypothetical protein